MRKGLHCFSSALNAPTDEGGNSTQKIVTKLLTRTNTVNGIIYGQDNTFLALETVSRHIFIKTPIEAES
jgi:hypothetical protein